jgi:hypothetical protein
MTLHDRLVSVERLANYLLKLNYEICLDAHPAPAGVRGRVLAGKPSRSGGI